MPYRDSRRAFTLIELLVVIAIIAILAVVVILTLNPAELLRQSRDSSRLSDLSTLSDAIGIYSTDQAGTSAYSLGATSTTYLSVYDPSATTTAGDQCQGLGMPSSYYSYGCGASSSYRTVSGNGWVPINFSKITAGAPFGNLPVDPTNQTSSNLYYTYETNGAVYQLSATMESLKYEKTGATDGSSDPTLAEAGSGLTSLPDTGRGLVVYWPLNEGGGLTAYDWGGGGNNGTWTGTQSGTNGYYSSGYNWPSGGYFNGTNDSVSASVGNVINPASTSLSFAGWFEPATSTNGMRIIAYAIDANNGVTLASSGGKFDFTVTVAGTPYGMISSAAFSINTWYFVAGTFNTNTNTGLLYVNGALVSGTAATTLGLPATYHTLLLGNNGPGSYFNGTIGDLRMYDYPLSASQVQTLYNQEH